MQRAADQIYIYWLLSLHSVVYLLILSSFLLVCQSNYFVYGIQILAFYASWLALPGSLVILFSSFLYLIPVFYILLYYIYLYYLLYKYFYIYIFYIL